MIIDVQRRYITTNSGFELMLRRIRRGSSASEGARRWKVVLIPIVVLILISTNTWTNSGANTNTNNNANTVTELSSEVKPVLSRTDNRIITIGY
jgi:hypothetical protein